MKLVAFKKNVPPILDWYNWEHMNVANVDASQSKWWVWDQTLEATHSAIIQIQTYLQRIEQGTPSTIFLHGCVHNFFLPGCVHCIFIITTGFRGLEP